MNPKSEIKTQRRITSQDVARIAGVSQPTVSRALAGDRAISQSTRERVFAAAKDLNYVMPRTNGGRGRRKNRVLGVVVAALNNSFYTYLLSCLHDELAAAGYSMILMIDQYESSEDLSKLQLLLDNTLDGVIFTTATVRSSAVRFLHESGVPLVLAVRSVVDLDVDVVESDNVMAGREAVQHLLQLGHRRIGFILGPRDTSTSIQRFHGARGTMTERGISVDEELCIWGPYSHEAGYSSVLNLWQRSDPPTAVICGNDVIAIGALDGARKRGIDVPSRLSIVGFDDIPMAGWANIQLTTVRQGIIEMAALTARRMLERIQSPEELPARRDLLPTSLIQRATTARPSAPRKSTRIG